MLVVALFHIVFFMNYTKGIINNRQSRNLMSQFYLRFVFIIVGSSLL